MKQSAKILSMLLVFVLLAVGLVIGIAANEEEPVVEYVDEINKITSYGDAVSGYSAIVYRSKADFEADKGETGVLDLVDDEGKPITPAKTYGASDSLGFYGASANANAADTYDNAYTYLLTDSSIFVSATLGFRYLDNYVVDFGGHKLTLESTDSAVYINIGAERNWDAQADVTFSNGTLSCEMVSSAQMLIVRTGALTFKDLNVVFPEKDGAPVYTATKMIRDDGGTVCLDNVRFDVLSVNGTRFDIIHRYGTRNWSTTEPASPEDKDKVTYNFNSVTLNSASASLYLYQHYYYGDFYEDVTFNITGETRIGANSQLFRCGGVVRAQTTNTYVNIYPGLTVASAPNFATFINDMTGRNGQFFPAGTNEVVIKYLDENGNEGIAFRDIEPITDTIGDVEVTYTKKLTAPTYVKRIGVDGEKTYYYTSTIDKDTFRGTGNGQGVYFDFYSDITCTGGGNLNHTKGSGESVVNLHGYKFNIANARICVAEEGDKITFVDGTIISDGGTAIGTPFATQGTLVLDNITFYHGFDTQTAASAIILALGNIEIKKSHLYFNTATSGGCIQLKPSAGKTATMTIEDTDIHCPNKSTFGSYWPHPFNILNDNGNTNLTLNMSGVKITGREDIDSTYGGVFRVDNNQSMDDTRNYVINMKDCHVDGANGLLRAINTKEDTNQIKVNISDTYFVNGNKLYSSNKDDDLFEVNYVTLDEEYQVVEGGKQALMDVTGAGIYKYVVAKPTNTALKTNLSLYSDFTLNLYVPVENNILNINDYEYVVDEVTKEKVVVTIDEVEHYVIAIKDITPTSATERIPLAVKFTKDGETRTLNASYSVIGYAKDFLNSENAKTDEAGTTLIKDTLAYIEAATLLADNTDLTTIPEIDALLGDYASTVTVPTDTVTLSQNEYIESATFDIVNNVTLLKLKLKVTDKTITVKAGGEVYAAVGSGEPYYVVVSLRAFRLADSFDIYADDEKLGTYSLASFYNSTEVKNASEEVQTLVKALYTYSVSAKNYKIVNAVA